MALGQSPLPAHVRPEPGAQRRYAPLARLVMQVPVQAPQNVPNLADAGIATFTIPSDCHNTPRCCRFPRAAVSTLPHRCGWMCRGRSNKLKRLTRPADQNHPDRPHPAKQFPRLGLTVSPKNIRPVSLGTDCAHLHTTGQASTRPRCVSADRRKTGQSWIDAPMAADGMPEISKRTTSP